MGHRALGNSVTCQGSHSWYRIAPYSIPDVFYSKTHAFSHDADTETSIFSTGTKRPTNPRTIKLFTSVATDDEGGIRATIIFVSGRVCCLSAPRCPSGPSSYLGLIACTRHAPLSRPDGFRLCPIVSWHWHENQRLVKAQRYFSSVVAWQRQPQQRMPEDGGCPRTAAGCGGDAAAVLEGGDSVSKQSSGLHQLRGEWGLEAPTQGQEGAAPRP